MIDSIYAKYARIKDKPPNKKYRPQDSIQGRDLINPKANRLAVVFPGWHTHNFPINHLVNRLAKKGWAVLAYDFHDQIIDSDDEAVARSFKYIRQQISRELKDLSNSGKYKQIQLIGISLGNVSMSLVAEQFNNFSGATFVVGGEDLAEDLWHGQRTLYIRDEFKKAHVGLRQLRQDWLEEAPSSHAKFFADKKVDFIMSKTDRFILPKYQRRLLDDLRENGADVSLQKRRTGHLLTIIRYCLFDRPLEDT